MSIVLSFYWEISLPLPNPNQLFLESESKMKCDVSGIWQRSVRCPFLLIINTIFLSIIITCDINKYADDKNGFTNKMRQ